MPGKIKEKKNNNEQKKKTDIEQLKIDDVEQRLEQFQTQVNGKEIDISSIKEDLQELKSDHQKQDIRMVLFGDISSGKSSLINALIPQAKGEVNVIGGTTKELKHYTWLSPLGESVIVTDTPGFDEHERKLDELSLESVYKAHIAIYLCEGDLTDSQFNQIKDVVFLNKPLVVALNKTDRYHSSDLDLISTKIKKRLDALSSEEGGNIDLVHIKTGGTKEVTIIQFDGSEKKERRPLAPELSQLLKSISHRLNKTSLNELEKIRQNAVLHFLSKNLDKAEEKHQQEKSKNIIKSSTKKAVVASMATITPGSDLLVQGYLAIAMIKELCKVYNVSVKDVDIDKLLSLLQKNTIGIFPLLLGLAGNAFKAFPGIGSIAGGFLHAVAYGLIFDSVGKSVNISLSTQGTISEALIEDIYKEKLLENIESRALKLVKMVIKSKTDSK